MSVVRAVYVVKAVSVDRNFFSVRAVSVVRVMSVVRVVFIFRALSVLSVMQKCSVFTIRGQCKTAELSQTPGQRVGSTWGEVRAVVLQQL